MIEYFEVTNEAGNTLHLSLSNFMESGILVTKVEGLGPVKSNINMSSYVDNDTKKVNSAILDRRNIRLTLRLFNSSDGTVEELRDKTYVYFPPEKYITLTVKTDKRFVNITGIVESNDPDIFSEEETEVISILCEDPMFYDVSGADTDLDDYDLNTVLPKLEFKLENNSLTEKLIELGEIRHTPINAINYEGEYDTGFTINIHCKGIVINPVIYSSRQNGVFRLLTDKLPNIIPGSEGRFKLGDSIMINTINGSKTIVLLRDGTLYNILHILESGSTWPLLKNGNNEFIVDAENGFEFLKLSYSYKTGYIGV